MSRARNISEGYRLLILDGHNSHCTYQFCSFAEKNKIIILCLPSHTTHILQPCDVGVFGPLASAWKSEVNKLTLLGIPITKFNLLEHYAVARERAFKAETIQSTFRKTGIEPFDHDTLDPAVFEPLLNTTIKSAQPLAATLPTYIPIKILPTGSNNENTPTPNFDNIETTDQQTASRTPADDTTTPTDDTTRPTNDTTSPAPPPHPPVRFRVIIPQPLPHTAS